MTGMRRRILDEKHFYFFAWNIGERLRHQGSDERRLVGTRQRGERGEGG
jgi:hypothetical protein